MIPVNDIVHRSQNEELSPEAWRERVLDGVGRSLDQLVAADEVSAFTADTERVTVKAMTDALQVANRVNDRLGAFYTTDRVRKVLDGVSRQAVSERVRANRLLRVDTADGEKLFPAFQFRDGRMVPGLQDLLRILLDSGVDGWTVAYWLTARIGQLGEVTAVDVLNSGDADRIAVLKALAAEDVASWRAAA